MKARIENGHFILQLPMEKALPLSKSGKARLVASSHGIQKTALKVEGKTVHVVLNAFISNADRKDTDEDDD